MEKITSRGIFLLLFVISVVALAVRLYKFDAPLGDWHSWRQADTASVARNFQRDGIDLLHPRYDDVSNIQSGFDNPEGYRMVEMPLYQVAGVWTHTILPVLSLESSLRVVSAVSTALSVFLLGILLLKFAGPMEAIAGSLAFALMPYSMYYGRTILPDAFAIFWALLSLVLLTRKQSVFIFLAAICAAISLLVRPMAVFLLAPAVYLIFSHHRFSFYSLIRLCIYSLIVLGPVLWWRQWILQFPEGIPLVDWIINKDGIRFKGAWFYWLFARRIAELILGWWGITFFGLGLVAKSKGKDAIFSVLWIVSMLSYFVIFASGNVRHDYYQDILIPVIAWFVGKGVGVLIRPTPFIYRPAAFGVVCLIGIFSWAFSWFTVRSYYWINRPEIIEAGKAADALLPPDAKVIASYNGDTTFLYHINRKGWPLGFEIPKKIAQGATHYVTISPTDADGETMVLARDYTVLVRNDRYAIIDLTRPAK
jgi:hypothetical protein